MSIVYGGNPPDCAPSAEVPERPPDGHPDCLHLMPLFPEQASASEVDNLYFFVTAVTAFVALLVVYVVVFAIRYRGQTGDRVGASRAGSIPLELGWSIVPLVTSWRSSPGRPSSCSTACGHRITRWNPVARQAMDVNAARTARQDDSATRLTIRGWSHRLPLVAVTQL
jgi:hypothetical protein